MKAEIRKLIVQVEETHQEGGESVSPPTRRAVAIAVIGNPYAGQFSQNLDRLIEIGEELGGLLGQRCVEALGIEPHEAQSYGKAAIVGEDGELEHAAAILHPKLGAPLRHAVSRGAALVPSAKKNGERSALRLIFRLDTKMLRSCAVTSMPLRRALPTPPGPAKLSLQLLLPTAVAPIRVLGDCKRAK